MNAMKKFGFTLIELMIVIAIIAVLAAIAIPSILSTVRAANERNASGSLKQLNSIQMTFRNSDRDGNAVNDFWTGDISGLYRIQIPGDSAPIRMIELSVALADGKRMNAVPPGQPFTFNTAFLSDAATSPKAGYYYQVLVQYETAPSTFEPYDDGTGHHADRFGFIAYPSSPGSSGTLIFILNEGGTMWKAGLPPPYVSGAAPAATLAPAYANYPLSPPSAGFGKMD